MPGWVSNVRDLTIADKAALQPVIKALQLAATDENSAIGTGLGQAALAVIETDLAYAAEIQWVPAATTDQAGDSRVRGRRRQRPDWGGRRRRRRRWWENHSLLGDRRGPDSQHRDRCLRCSGNDSGGHNDDHNCRRQQRFDQSQPMIGATSRIDDPNSPLCCSAIRSV